MKNKFKIIYFPKKTERFINNKKSSNIEYFSTIKDSNFYVYEFIVYNEYNEIRNKSIENFINDMIFGIGIRRYKK